MKKILCLLIFTFLSLVSFSQVTFVRAYKFANAYKSLPTDQFVWGEEVPCNILIRFEGLDVTIYSKVIQKYHFISKVADLKGSEVYRIIDSNGTVCNFYQGVLDSGALFISIEYLDFTWVYFVNLEE